MTNINPPTAYETFTDLYGNHIKFLMTFLDIGDKYCVSAQEITDDPNPRVFHGYDDEYMEAALTKVRKVLKEELNTTYFDTEGNNPFYHLKNWYFRGHVGDTEDGDPVIMVDGKVMTLEDFGEFLKPLDGFRIEVRILE